ncbi:DUF1840 domain-containing protein [Piscinibacter sakaiensis]|uniref:DUF1840 domain-containing protein n=1 Tax=Piscinibacter sakaiensis TaxID=1547922 RepID=A0A0K8P4I5_PISS1|nr:DUF1840 domain-containing protein [Piscinibacter sakaiensis]GAP37583.1 hypothetical protein ISF6_3528 [Piscinibacter sakaiensis]
MSLYKFRSKSSGDLIMMGPNGDQLLGLIGKAPAAQGILPAAELPAAIAALERAVAEAEATAPRDAGEGEADEPDAKRAVGLRQRVWPMVEMMKRASAAGHDIVWGV